MEAYPDESDLTVKIAALLHSRGREVTPDQVGDWLIETEKRWNRTRSRTLTCDDIANAVLQGNQTMTMCLHLKFGDAL